MYDPKNLSGIHATGLNMKAGRKRGTVIVKHQGGTGGTKRKVRRGR